MLEGLVYQSRHYRNCLTEIGIYILDSISKNMLIFQSMVNEKSFPHRVRKVSIDSSYSMIVQIINDYYASIDHLSKILNTLDLSLKNLNIKFRQNLEITKGLIMEALNSLYSI